MSVPDLAGEALKFFKRHKRGEEEIWVFTDEAPIWVKEMAFRAHGDMMPDDRKFEFVVEALGALSEAESDASEDELREMSDRLEADIYNADLLRWLSSHLERSGYVDEATGDYGHSDMGIMGDIMLGQLREKEEVFNSIMESLMLGPDELEEQSDLPDKPGWQISERKRWRPGRG